MYIYECGIITLAFQIAREKEKAETHADRFFGGLVRSMKLSFNVSDVIQLGIWVGRHAFGQYWNAILDFHKGVRVLHQCFFCVQKLCKNKYKNVFFSEMSAPVEK